MEFKEQIQRILENVPKVYEAGRSSIKNDVSNALKGSASGEAVALEDVSPIEHNLGVRMKSKNLADIYGFSTEAIQNVNDNRFLLNEFGTTISTTDAANAVEVIQTKSPNASDVISYENGYFCIGIHNNFRDGDIVTVSFDMEITSNPLNATEGLVMSNGFNADRYELKNGRCSATLAWGNYNDRKYIEIRNAGCSAVFSNFQVELGTKATPYTPYIADTSGVKLKVQGANLLSLDKIIDWGNCSIENGVVTQTEADTSQPPYLKAVVTFDSGEYELMGKSEAVTASGKVSFQITCAQEINKLAFGFNGSVIDTMVRFDNLSLPAGTYIASCNVINATQGSISWKDMQIALVDTDYEPYKEPIEYSQGEDIKSIAPCTTIMTDTEGAVISVEYNRDLNKAFEELMNLILSLGGNVYD